MPDSHTDVYVHAVWGTVGRASLLTGDVRTAVLRCIHAECQRLGAQLVRAGGIENHMHVLVRVPAQVAVARLMKQIKGVSSHLVRSTGLHEGFSWQEGYSAFSISRWGVPKLAQYIDRQPEHHRDGTAIPVLEHQVGVSRT